mgnify:CR=1 FL=1
MSWEIVYAKQAQKDAKKLSSAGLKDKATHLINIIKENPYQNPSPYEKLIGDLSGSYSRRINIQHHLVYQTYKNEIIIKVIRLWTHYE